MSAKTAARSSTAATKAKSKPKPPPITAKPPSILAGRKHERAAETPDDTDAEPSTPILQKPKRVRFAEASLGVNAAASPAPIRTNVGQSTTNDIFRKFVTSALEERAKGKSGHYDELRRKFRVNPAKDDPDDPAPASNELRLYLHALTGCVASLGANCAELVRDVVNARWIGRDDLFVSAYVKFLGNLVSAHAGYMGIVTKMLVSKLGYLGWSEGRIRNYPVVDRETMYDRIHYALQYILDLVPTAAVSTLFPELVSKFPHRSEKRQHHTAYLKNVLRVVDYVPALRQKLVAVATDKTLRIDVEIQGYLEDLDEDDLEQLEEDLLADDPDAEDVDEDDDSDLESDEEDDDDETPKTPAIMIRETAHKLDDLLHILFGYLSTSFTEPTMDKSIQPSHSAQSAFSNIHATFFESVFPTHRSRFTQFLVFWAAQQSPLFSDRFCVSLIERAFDVTKPMHLRLQAASYLACYVARAKRMPANDIRSVVRLLCRWLGEYVDVRSPECTGPDANRYAGFYAITQAVLYIFCFRFRELREPLEDDEDDSDDDTAPPTTKLRRSLPMPGGRWTPGLDLLNKVVMSRFNPLLICSRLVVDMFARVAQEQEFLFCYTVIEQNKRRGYDRATSSLGDNRKGGVGVIGADVDPFFPFDPPDMLKKTKGWVEDLLNVWDGDDSDDEAGDSDDDSDESEDEADITGEVEESEDDDDDDDDTTD